jgi:hypothetical protein
MAGVRPARFIEDALAIATMKVSQSHFLLSGIVESAVLPDVQASARACLETLERAVTDLREVAVSLRASPRE